MDSLVDGVMSRKRQISNKVPRATSYTHPGHRADILERADRKCSTTDERLPSHDVVK